jgi:hypothetical protein
MQGPKREGYYQGRILDCRDDLSARVLRHLDGSRGGSDDDSHILRDVMPDAKAAGWGEQEVLACVKLITGVRLLRMRS